MACPNPSFLTKAKSYSFPYYLKSIFFYGVLVLDTAISKAVCLSHTHKIDIWGSKRIPLCRRQNH